MTLFGWMHRKLKSSNDAQKDLSIGVTGQLSLNDQHFYPRDRNGNQYYCKPQEDKSRRSLITLEATKVHENLGEEPADALTELFHGFLNIGTLGTESLIKDQDKPKFSIYTDGMAEEKVDVMEDELELIKHESGKVLEADHNDESSNDSYDGTSLISSAEKSECSLITLGNVSTGSTEAYGNTGVTCYNQSCPSGSTAEPSDAVEPVTERHTTLEDLFHKTEQVEENYGIKSDKGKNTSKQSDNSTIHLIKKYMKKKTVQYLGKSSTHDSGGTSQSTPKETMHKIVQAFSNKVHPGDSLLGASDHKPGKIWSKKKTTCSMEHNSSGNRSLDGDIIICPQDVFPQQTSCNENQSHVQLLMKASLNSIGNEFWIKTDADYVVLEF